MSSQKLAKLARHPLSITLLGFLLTGIVGTWFSTMLSEQASRREAEAASRSRGVEAIHEIVDLINERRTRAVMLEYAITRDSPKEAETRKALYDEVYVRWNTQEHGRRLRIQEFMETVSPADYEAYMDAFTMALTSTHALTPSGQKLHAGERPGLLTRMDGCLTDAFDEYRKTKFADAKPATALLDKCRFDQLDNQTIDCTRVIADSLYGIIRSLNTKEAAAKRVQDDANRIRDQCVLPSAWDQK